MTKVTLSETQWQSVIEALLDTQDKSLIYLAKEIQMQVVRYDSIQMFKENLRRNGLRI